MQPHRQQFLDSVRNTWVFLTALTALMEPGTLRQRITRHPSHRRWIVLHTAPVVASIPWLCFLRRVALYTHVQNDTCVTLFQGALVTLQPFTQRLELFMPFSGQVPHFTSSLLLFIRCRTLLIYMFNIVI